MPLGLVFETMKSFSRIGRSMDVGAISLFMSFCARFGGYDHNAISGYQKYLTKYQPFVGSKDLGIC